MKQVNNSPSKSINNSYLTSENKKEFRLNGIIEHKEDYIEEGKLKK